MLKLPFDRGRCSPRYYLVSHYCVEADRIYSREIRRPQIERLLQLAQQKRVLEEKIEKCYSELDQMFLVAANQLQVVLDGRIETLSE